MNDENDMFLCFFIKTQGYFWKLKKLDEICRCRLKLVWCKK